MTGDQRFGSLAFGGLRRRAASLVGGAMLAAVALMPAGCVIVVDDTHSDGYIDDGGHSGRKTIGVILDDVSREAAAQLELDRDHVTLITHVYRRTPADRAGLQRYDIVTSVDGRDGASPAQIRAAIRDKDHGDDLRLGVLRGGKPMEVRVEIEDH
ncbi:MAG: PDZ domain-containing protein [Phycisphaerales bacterium]